MKFDLTVEELQTSQFDDKEFNELVSNNQLTKMLICRMFDYIPIKFTQQILSKMSTENWMEKFYWTYEQHDKCLADFAKVYKNVYRYGDRTSMAYAIQFLTQYGFNIRDTKENEEKHFLNLLNYENGKR